MSLDTPPLNVMFTNREKDIISCLLNGRGIKKSANLLSISPKTVEGHIHNIMVKIGCNSREGIIDYIEKSGNLADFKKPYQAFAYGEEVEPTVSTSLSQGEEKGQGRELLDSLELIKKREKGVSQETPSFVFFRRSDNTQLGKGRFVFFAIGGCFLIVFLFIGAGKLMFFFENSSRGLSYVRPVRSEIVLPHEGAFLNRSSLIKKINQCFKSNQEIQTVVFVGAGGAGKTTLARHFGRQQNVAVMWEINAETKDQLILCFERLAEALAQTEDEQKKLQEIQDIPIAHQRENRLFSYLKQKLSTCGNWLLIYDNVEKFSDVHPYLPYDSHLWGKGKVIITTQSSIMGNHIYVDEKNIIKIGELSLEEGMELFTKILNSDKERPENFLKKEEVRKFVEKLPPFPLDISTAAYYLKFTNISYQDYLTRMEGYDEGFKETQNDILKDIAHYTKTRYGIMSASIQQLLENQESRLEPLMFISLLNSQGIPQELIKYRKDAMTVDKLLYQLNKCCLILGNSSSHAPTFSLHRSIQGNILCYLTKTLSKEKAAFLIKTLAENFSAYIDKILETEDVAQIKDLIPHLQAFLEKSDLPEIMKADLKAQLGHFYWYTFLDFAKSRDLLEESLSIYRASSEAPQLKIAWTLNQLGVAYKLWGALSHKEPQFFLEQSLALYRSYYGNDNHTEIGGILVTLSGIYRKSATYDRAQEALERALSIYKNLYGEADLKTAWVWTSYGRFYRSFGDYIKAKDLLERGIEIHKKNSYKNYMERAWPIINVGIIYKHIGNYEKAKEVIEEGLAIYQEHLSDSHIEIGWTLVHLGPVYGYLGDWIHAQQMVEKGLSIFKKYYGEDNVENAWVLRELGAIYKEKGNYQKALSFLEESQKLYEKHQGSEYIEIAFVLTHMGHAYLLQEELEKAEPLLLKAFHILKKNNHPKIYRALERLVDLYLKKASQEKSKGNEEKRALHENEAKKYLEDLIALVDTYFPEDSPYVGKLKAKKQVLEQGSSSF